MLYIINTIPPTPVTLFINEVLAVTVLMLSLIMLPAMGISLPAAYLNPFIARLSALDDRAEDMEIRPVKNVKLSPTVQRHSDLRVFDTLDRFTLFTIEFMQIIANIAFIIGNTTLMETN